MTGFLLDREVERAMDNFYYSEKDNSIKKCRAISSTSQNSKVAIVFLHGYGVCPDSFVKVVNEIKSRLHADIYVPRLPFHGEKIATFARLNNLDIEGFIDNFVAQLSIKYKTVFVIAHSYAGTHVINLLEKKNFLKM